MEPSSSQNPNKVVTRNGKTVQYVDEQGHIYSAEPIQYEPIYYEENGSTLIYDQAYQSLSQEIYHEEIVGEEEFVESLPSTSTAPPPPAPPAAAVTNKHRLIKDGTIGYQNSTVLLTNQSLKAENATYLAKCGKRPVKKLLGDEKKVATVNGTGSILNRNLPGMTNMFKVLKESTIKKMEESLKHKQDEAREKVLESTTEDPEVSDDENDEASRSPPPMERLGVELEFQNAVFDQWPLYSNQEIDFKDCCELFIGMQEVDEEKVCKTLPLQFKHEGTFLIDLRAIHDVNSDDNGGWGVPSGKTRFYKEMDSGNMLRVDDGKGRLKGWTKDYTYKVMLKRYENRVTRNADDGRGSFQKKIYTGFKGEERLPFAIIAYSWYSGRPWNFVPPIGKVTKQNWEKKSYGKVDMTSMPQMVSAFYEGFNIYSHCIISFDEASAIMLGATVVDSNKLCSSVPLGYRQNGTFVIDLKRMGHCLLELRRDENGLWTKPSGFSRFYKFAENGDALRVDKAGKLIAGVDFDVKISSKRYEHTQVDKKFVRKIYTAKGKNSDSFPGSPEYAVIVYYWKGEPILFEPSYKQNAIRMEAKEYNRYQQMAEDEQDFVETSEAMPTEIVVEEAEEQGVEMIDKDHQPPTLKRARFSNEQSGNFLEMKMTLIRREMENQDRFAALLDRADGMLARMEQRFGMEPVYAPQNVVPQWNHGEEVEEIIEEEVIQEF